MHYLVTGAGGFAGRYLVDLLAESGHQVTGVVRNRGALKGKPAEEVAADILDRPAVAKVITSRNFDGIFHLAAPETSVGRSWDDPAATLEQNLAAAASVFQAAADAPTPPRVVFTSTAEISSGVDSPYALSKQLGEQAAAFYADSFAVPIIIARPGNHTGPGQRTSFAIPGFVEQIVGLERAGEGVVKVGNLAAKRDFSDVRDIVSAYSVLMERGQPGRVYPIGSGKAMAVSELLEFLIEQSTAKITVTVDQSRFRPVDASETVVDAGELAKLGWQPRHSIRDTLRDMLAAARTSET